MKKLASASPSSLYEHYNCLNDIIIEAMLIDDNKVIFIETHKNNPSWIVEIKTETVHALFANDKPKKERPFLIKENFNFYAVLNRDKERYQEIFKKLKHGKFIRTKQPA